MGCRFVRFTSSPEQHYRKLCRLACRTSCVNERTLVLWEVTGKQICLQHASVACSGQDVTRVQHKSFTIEALRTIIRLCADALSPAIIFGNFTINNIIVVCYPCARHRHGHLCKNNLCKEHYLCFPLVGDQQVVGSEVPMHHIMAVHEFHCCSGLAG